MTPNEFNNMTMQEKVSRFDDLKVTRDTYIYFADDFEMYAIEKRDRHARPEDELLGGEYVRRTLDIKGN